MPATPWTELTATQAGWQEGFETGDGSTDFYIDVLFEGTGFFAVLAPSYTELSIGATASTELTAPSTPWVEITF